LEGTGPGFGLKDPSLGLEGRDLGLVIGLEGTSCDLGLKDPGLGLQGPSLGLASLALTTSLIEAISKKSQRTDQTGVNQCEKD